MGEPSRRPIFDRLPSETIADFVNRAISRQARDASLSTGPAHFVFKPKRKFQLQIPISLEVRDGHPEERDDPLVRMIREGRANKLLGDFGKARGR